MQALQAGGEVLLPRGLCPDTPGYNAPYLALAPGGFCGGEEKDSRSTAHSQAVRVAKRKQGAWTFLGGFLRVAGSAALHLGFPLSTPFGATV